MNLQTEKLDNHVARLTVQIELDQLERAKSRAAKKLSRRVNIPGFRKGKAPYRVLVSYIGEGPIIEDAIEELGNQIYKQALDESKVEPYSSGELENFTLDPPTFVFTVPLQPTVELNDYRSVRVDYEEVEVKDEDVDEALKRLQEQHAVVEESASAAAMGDKVTVDVSGNFTDEADDEDEDDDHDEHEHDEDDDEHEHHHDHSAPIHQHDAEIYLDTDREPLPGFAEALVGASVGDTVVFELTYPDDDERYGDFAGREVKFSVDVKRVENVTLPALNDEFAARVSEDDPDVEEPLTLLELRARLRRNIKEQLEREHDSAYADEVMDRLVEIGEFAYPEAMIVNQIDSMIESTAQRVGISVEDYLRLLQKAAEDIHEDETYRESAMRYIERSLVMRGILDNERLQVLDADIDEEIDRMLMQFGEQAEMYRSLFDTADMRSNMRNSVLERKILDRIVAIGRGIAPELGADEAVSDDEVADADDTVDVVEDTDADNAETVAEQVTEASNEDDSEPSE